MGKKDYDRVDALGVGARTEERIGAIVARARTEAGLSQSALAERVSSVDGMAWTQTTVWNIEHGTRVLRASELPILAVALGTPVDLLLREVGGPYTARAAIRDLKRAHEELGWKLADFATARTGVADLDPEDAAVLGDLDPEDASAALASYTLRSAAEAAATDVSELWAEERAGKTPLTGEDILNM